MRVGVSLRSAFTVADPREGARRMVESAAAARDAGLDSLFVGDHHAVGAPYYQNVAILGRLLAEWDERPAGALFLLPLWNPLLLAEQIGTLASVARGRFVMQCALGDGDRQFAAMGARMRTRPSSFERNLDVVRRLIAGEAVAVGTAPPTRIAPVPREPVEVWIGGTARAAVDRAARLGDAWLAGPELTRARARELAAYYLERCAAHARVPAAVAIRRDVYVGADDADAEAVAGPVVARGYRGFHPDAVVYGGPESVAARFAELASMGYTDVLVRHLADDHASVLASFERLGFVRKQVLGEG